MKCPKCNFDNPEGNRFCESCGTKLELICTKCGKSVPISAKFCPECGAKISEVSTKVVHTIPAVPEEIARKIESVKKELKGSRRDVAVIFADVSGFTAMSERLDPEEVTNKMNAVFQRLSDVIYRYEGYIDKFIGDCVMVLFGAPIAHEDDPLRSVLCALDMMAVMKEFEGLELSIGVNFGRVMAGGVGVDQKMEYTVMGDTVNLAQRLQSAAGKGQVFVSQKIYELTRNEVEYKKLKPIKVKGKTMPVPVYQPQHIRSKYSLRRIRELPLIGRKEELEKILSLFENVKSGRGEIVSVIGEAGIGKSKLVYEFRQRLQDDTLFLEGRGIEYLKTSPYWALKEVLKDLFLIEDADTKEEMSEKIERFMDEVLKNIRVSEHHGIRKGIPFLKYLFSLKLDKEQHSRFESMRPEDRIRMIEEAIIYLFQTISRQKPLVMLFEDTHWIDTETLNFSYKLAQKISKNRIMLLYLYRPELEIEVSSLPYHTQINLKHLTEAEAIELVREMFGCKKVSNKLKELLLDKSGSNPFFLQELATTLLNGKLIQIERNIANLKDGKAISVPDSLNELIMSRIDRFDEELKLVIEAASVIGEEFSTKLLDGLIELGPRLKTNLEIIEKQDLISRITSGILSGEDEYAFKHIITRDVIYESLLKSKRIEYHKKIGAVVEKIYAGNLDEYLDALSYHYKLGEDKEKAVEYLEKSADRKKELYKNEEAIATYQECIDLLKCFKACNDRIAKIYEKIGNIHALIGRYNSAIESYDQMAEYGESDPLTMAQSMYLKAGIAQKQGKYDSALTLLDKARDLAPDTIVEARVLALYCWIYRIKGRMDSAIEMGNKGMQLLKGLKGVDKKELSRAEAQINNNIAVVYKDKGNYGKAIELYQKYLKISEKLGDKQGIGAASNNLGNVYLYKGNYGKAIELYQKCLKISEELGDKQGIGIASLNLGGVYSDKGDYDKAIELYQKKLKISEELGDKRGIGVASLNLGTVYKERGDYDKAIELYQKKLKISEELGDKQGIGIAFGNLGIVYKERGDYDKAIELLEKYLKISEELGDKQGIGRASLNLGGVYKELGQLADANRYLNRAWFILKEIGDKASLSETAYALAELVVLTPSLNTFTLFSVDSVKRKGNNFAKEKRFEKAEIYAQEGLRLAEELNSKSLKAMGLYTFGKLWTAENKRAKAEDSFKRAIELYKELKEKKALADAYFEYGKLLWQQDQRTRSKKQKGKRQKADGKKYLEEAKKIYKELKLEHKVKEIEKMTKSE